MKFPSIRQTVEQSPTIQDLIECVEILTGRRRNREIDYGTIDGVRTKVLDIVHLCNMINQLHESGVMNADFEKLQDTVDKLSQLHESGVTTDDLEKLHDITVEAARINTIGKIKARAYRKAAQNIDADGYTKVAIDTIDRDTEGVVDTTNSRIIPNLPGDYVVMGNVYAGSEPSDLRIDALIYKNGVPASYGTSGIQDKYGFVSLSVSDLIYMNGTDDYLELWVLNNSSSASALAYSTVPTGCPINYISVLGPF